MKVKIKKINENAIIPSCKIGDAGMDLTSIAITEETPTYIEHDTGIIVQIPEGHVGLIFPRSSISKYDVHLCNAVGVVDSSYRGSIKCRFRRDVRGVEYNELIEVLEEGNGKAYYTSITYKVGDKIAQLIILPYPEIEWEEVEELDSTERGSGGFGSSGN